MEIAIGFDLRELFGPARDQGPRPTCMAFAASDTHAAVRPNWVPLSCEYAYFHALRRDGGHPNEGATAASILTAIREDGQPPESDWPYLGTIPDSLTLWKPPGTVTALFRRGSVYGSPTISAIVDRLDSGAPILLIMRLSDTFFTPDADGVIATEEPPDPQRRHAVIAVGYGFRGEERVFLIRNSWGESWGIRGYAWLSEKYLAARIDTIVEMKEDLTNVSRSRDEADLRSSLA